ncbi:phosphoglycerate dehydrogenase [Arcanobacterium haemolyticum]|nr:phosphoglycerate dehydrogenase [Arcanobacterium haemolyticum]
MPDVKVLVTARSFGASDSDALDLLSSHDYTVERVAACDVREKIGQADAIIAGLEQYDAELLSCAPRLKVISRYGVGYDAVDLATATERGIVVTNTPGANNESVADLAFALMMTVARNIPFMDHSIREGDSKRPIGLELCGKTVGIVGTGAIGRGVARRCKGFGIRVLAYDVNIDNDFARDNDVTYVPLDELLIQSDFVTLHLPLMPETRHIISAERLALMKPDAIIVNTARGGLIDDEALVDALENHRIRGAGLDVLEGTDLRISAALESSPNCVLTPHAGAATLEASHRQSVAAAQNVIDVLETGKSLNVVPPQRDVVIPHLSSPRLVERFSQEKTAKGFYASESSR